KKLIIGILTGAVLLGSATFVAAESNGNGFFNSEAMKPYIEEMHPTLSPEQQEAMFNNCHGENGMMQNNTGFRDMMNNISFRVVIPYAGDDGHDAIRFTSMDP